MQTDLHSDEISYNYSSQGHLGGRILTFTFGLVYLHRSHSNLRPVKVGNESTFRVDHT